MPERTCSPVRRAASPCPASRQPSLPRGSRTCRREPASRRVVSLERCYPSDVGNSACPPSGPADFVRLNVVQLNSDELISPGWNFRGRNLRERRTRYSRRNAHSLAACSPSGTPARPTTETFPWPRAPEFESANASRSGYTLRFTRAIDFTGRSKPCSRPHAHIKVRGRCPIRLLAPINLTGLSKTERCAATYVRIYFCDPQSRRVRGDRSEGKASVRFSSAGMSARTAISMS
jgi:hypothetical protein